VGIDEYQTLHAIEKGYIGEEITFKGLPSSKGIGSAIAYQGSLAISDKSQNKEGAWEFVKVFLKEDFQDKTTNTGLGFPLKKSSLEKLAENTKNPPKDQVYNRIESTVFIGNEPKEIGFIDDAGIEKVNKLITSISSAVNYDANISKIIEEEMEVFYKGDKTAQEVAKLIQNRVNTYINEIK
jgi:ABC-type glycerol-3-phosphate transport system substrate-binding protein